MREQSWPPLLELLPLAWWETDCELRTTAHGGGAAPHALGPGAPASDVAMHTRALSGETVRWRARSGDRLLDAVVGPRRDAAGRVLGTAGAAVDVTVAVHERERYAAFAAYVPAAAFVRDASGRYVWVNEAYARVYGSTPAAIIGRALDDVVAPSDVPRFRALDREALERRRPVRHALTFRRRDGSSGQAVGHRFPLETASLGPCVGGIYVDVTDQVQALAQQARAQEDLAALRDRSGAAALTLSLDGRIERASPGAAELLGTTAAALEGGHIRHYVSPPETDRLLAVRRSLVRGRVVRLGLRLRCRTTSGAQRLVRVDLAIARTEGGRPRLLALVTPLGAEHRTVPELAPAQEQVLLRLARGESNAGISRALGITRQALDYHLRRLRSVLGAASRPAAVARGYALGLLDASVWPPALTSGGPSGGGVPPGDSASSAAP
ncbi:PAS domain S-box protein [Streptomyces sp. NPDC048629]|uniref:PAS domain S-box protein n=1 Tax=Streptomyces sp. NPDC048629 TaxID=3154824 RepID=UPI003438612D